MRALGLFLLASAACGPEGGAMQAPSSPPAPSSPSASSTPAPPPKATPAPTASAKPAQSKCASAGGQCVHESGRSQPCRRAEQGPEWGCGPKETCCIDAE